MIESNESFNNLFCTMYLYCFRHEIGLSFFNMYKKEKTLFKEENNYSRVCYICNKRCKRIKTMSGRQERGDAITVDHIIPRSFCYKLGRYDLVVDRRNFAICCRSCNEERSRVITTVGDLRREIGDKVVSKLIEGTGLTDEDSLNNETT